MDAGYSKPEIRDSLDSTLYIERIDCHTPRQSAGNSSSKAFSFLDQSLSCFFEQLHLFKQREAVSLQDRSDFQKRVRAMDKDFFVNSERIKSLAEIVLSFSREIFASTDLKVDLKIPLKTIQDLTKILDLIARSNHFEDLGVVRKILVAIETSFSQIKPNIAESIQEKIHSLTCIFKEVNRVFRALEIDKRVFQGVEETNGEEESSEFVLMASAKKGAEKFINTLFKYETRSTVVHLYLDFLLEKRLPQFSLEDFPLLIDLALTSDFQRNSALLGVCEDHICRIFAEQQNSVSTALALINYLEVVLHDKRLATLAPRFSLRAAQHKRLFQMSCQNALRLEIEKNPTSVRKRFLVDSLLLIQLNIESADWQRIFPPSSGRLSALNPANFLFKKQESFHVAMKKHLEKISEHFSCLTFGQMCYFYSNLISYFREAQGAHASTFFSLERFEEELYLSILRDTPNGSVLENTTEEMIRSLRTVRHFFSQDSRLLKELHAKLKSPFERRRALEDAIDRAATPAEVEKAFGAYLRLFNKELNDDKHFVLVGNLSRIIETDPLFKRNSKELYKLISNLGQIEFDKEGIIQTADKVIVPFCFYQSRFVESDYVKRAFPLATPCAIAYKRLPKKNIEGLYTPSLKFLFYSRRDQEFENVFSRLLNAMWQVMNEEITHVLNNEHPDLFMEDVAWHADALRELIAPSLIFNITNLKTLLRALSEENSFTAYLSKVHASVFASLSARYGSLRKNLLM